MSNLSRYGAMGAALKDSEPRKQDTLNELGGMLRDARQSFELSKQDVAEAICIRSDYLEALESGDWSVIPGEVYARGYLKKYADYLGFAPSVIHSRLHPVTKPIELVRTPICISVTLLSISVLLFSVEVRWCWPLF